MESLLNLEAVRERTSLSRSAIYDAMAAGEFPKPVHPAKRAARWVSSEIDAWIARLAERRDSRAA